MPLDRASPISALAAARPVTRRRPLPTVQLRHDLPDGSWHVDWMLARGDDPAAGLITLRLASPLAELAPGHAVEGHRIGDHRAAYLDYEGPVSGGRGEVRRLCRGRITSWAADGASWLIEVSWDAAAGTVGSAARYRLEPIASDRWRVRRLGPAPGPAAKCE